MDARYIILCVPQVGKILIHSDMEIIFNSLENKPNNIKFVINPLWELRRG